MARYILIDTHSGYIFGDTADYAAGRQSDITSIADAARMLDESIGEVGRRYTTYSSRPDGAAGYEVYRADVGGSESVGTIRDGQDQAMIDAVVSDCEYAGFVLCDSLEGGDE